MWGCMVRPLRMVIRLGSVLALPDLYLPQLHPTHDWPSYTLLATCPRPQLVIAYQRGGEGHVPLLFSLVTNEPTWNQFPRHWPSPPPFDSQDCHHVLPALHFTGWGVTSEPCFRHVSSPTKPLMSLLLTPHSSIWRLGKHRRLVGLRAAIQQMGKVEFSYSPDSFDLKELRTYAFLPFWVCLLFFFSCFVFCLPKWVLRNTSWAAPIQPFFPPVFVASFSSVHKHCPVHFGEDLNSSFFQIPPLLLPFTAVVCFWKWCQAGPCGPPRWVGFFGLQPPGPSLSFEGQKTC